MKRRTMNKMMRRQRMSRWSRRIRWRMKKKREKS